MISGHTGHTLTTYFRSMGKGRDHAVDSPAPNATQKTESRAADEAKDFAPPRATVIGKWICLVLGVVCIDCGIFGIFTKYIAGPPSSVAWPGSAYIPALRVTALLCLFMGLLLVRYGWSSSAREPRRSEHEKRP
jgi:hypothetical protein